MKTRLVSGVLISLITWAFSLAPLARANSVKIELAPGLPSLPLPIPGLSRLTRQAGFAHTNKTRIQAINLVHQGCQLDRQGKHHQAMRTFEAAYALDPDYELALSNLVTTYLVNGRLEDGLSAGKQFLARFSESLRGEEVSCMVKSMQTELRRRAVVQYSTGMTVTPDTSDYFAFQLIHALKRWPTENMPIKVFIASGQGVNCYRSSFRKDLIESFREWENHTNEAIRFVFVSDAQAANIECIWIDDPSDFPCHSGMEGGETIPSYNQHGLSHTKMMLLTIARNSTGKESDAAMRHICLHEIGHCLGLIEHSNSPDDIMFYAFQGDDHTRPHLSSRDVKTLMHLYAFDIAQNASPHAASLSLLQSGLVPKRISAN